MENSVNSLAKRMRAIRRIAKELFFRIYAQKAWALVCIKKTIHTVERHVGLTWEVLFNEYCNI